MKPELFELLVEQIREDLSNNDETAIEELFSFIHPKVLLGYLSEERAIKYRIQCDQQRNEET